jgi:hypothetical protein
MMVRTSKFVKVPASLTRCHIYFSSNLDAYIGNQFGYDSSRYAGELWLPVIGMLSITNTGTIHIIYILIYCIDMLWYVKILTLLTNDYLDMGHNFDGMDHFGLRHEWHTSDSYLAARSPSAVAPGTWRVLLWIGIQCMPEYKNLGKLRCSNWLLTNLAVVIDPNQLITNQFGSGSSNSNQLQWGR